MLRKRPSKYMKHQKGLGFSKWRGKWYYFGRYDEPGSLARYKAFRRQCQREIEAYEIDRLIQQADRVEIITVHQLFARFEKHVIQNRSAAYARQVQRLRAAAKRSFRKRMPVAAVGSHAITRFRRLLARGGWTSAVGYVAAPWSKSVVIGHMRIVAAMFSWGVSEGIVPVATYERVKAACRETVKMRKPMQQRDPPDWSVIQRIEPFVSRSTWDRIQVQYLTGMRPGEVCRMRLSELERSQDGLWFLRPRHHKTAWRGATKEIVIGPQAIAILRPYVELVGSRKASKPDSKWDYLFTEATAWLLWRRLESPMYHRRMVKRRQRQAEGKRVDKIRVAGPASYYQAVHNGIRKANAMGVGIPYWHPHELHELRWKATGPTFLPFPIVDTV